MYEVSKEYTKLMDDDRSELDVYVRVTLGDGYAVLDGDVIESIELNERVNSNSNILTFGNACSHSVEIALREPPELQYKGLLCVPECGIMLPDETIEWVPLGKFWIDNTKTDNDYKTVIVTAYDKMYKLNDPYTTALKYPALIEDVVAEFELITGVKVVKPEVFPKFYIQRKVEDGKYTCRDIAGHLAGCLGKNATFNRNGELEFIYYTQTAVKATEDLQYMRGFEKLSDNALKVDFLVIGQEEDEKIEIENDGTDPGELDWRGYDSEDPADYPWLTFTYDDEALTASVSLTEGYEEETDGIGIPYSLFYNDNVYVVTAIDNDGFDSCKMHAIALPYSLTTIGEGAFRYCDNLTEITIPENVTTIGSSGFFECSNIETIYFNATNCTSVGGGLYKAFSHLPALKNVVIGGNVEIIPPYMLNGCEGVTKIVIPDSVTTIGGQAFAGCKGLPEITIPENVTTIESSAFSNCTSLKTVYWNAVSLAEAGKTTGLIFSGCSALTDFIIGNNVEIIPANVLRGCTGIASIFIPYSVKTLGSYAFYGCTGLAEIAVPKNVDTLGDRVFCNCTNLATVYWNAINVTTVGKTTRPIFDGCTALVNFIIADDVTGLPMYMLKSCPNITSVVVPASVETIGSQAFSTTSLTDITIYKATDSISGSPWGASNATVSWMIGE